MKKTILMTFASLALATGAAWAGGDHGSHHADTKVAAAETAAASMTEGEVRKVDMDNKKITIKHGEIKNLQMPGMTMVFQVKDPAVLEKVKAGDKIRFNAEKANGAIVVTEIQPAK
ncbi:MAG: copper-binding protein [Pseudomonadota bacterium]